MEIKLSSPFSFAIEVKRCVERSRKWIQTSFIFILQWDFFLLAKKLNKLLINLRKKNRSLNMRHSINFECKNSTIKKKNHNSYSMNWFMEQGWEQQSHKQKRKWEEKRNPFNDNVQFDLGYLFTNELLLFISTSLFR